MPEAWVRGAILVRLNSLIRGHSAVRWELLEKMVTLLREDITPCVPLRGSISASGGTFFNIHPTTPRGSCPILFLLFVYALHARSYPVSVYRWGCCRHP